MKIFFFFIGLFFCSVLGMNAQQKLETITSVDTSAKSSNVLILKDGTTTKIINNKFKAGQQEPQSGEKNVIQPPQIISNPKNRDN